MSHVHVGNVAESAHPLHATRGAQILLVRQRSDDGNHGDGQVIVQEKHNDGYQTGKVVGVVEGERSMHIPSTITLAPGQTTTTNIQVINQDGATEHSVILTYPSSATDHSNSNSPVPVTEITLDSQKSCLICGDKGSGFHYSAFSCEGCKGFFKRTVQKTLAYNCKGEGDCVINKYTRNSCQHCRFQRCLEVGMRREAVREDRSPGGKHRRKRQKVDGPSLVLTESYGSSNPGTNFSERHMFKDPLLESIVQAKPYLVPKVEGNLSVDSLSINELMQYGYMELRYIIEWAKKVPGFKGLGVDDQMALLKSAFMELNVLRLSYRSLGTEGNIKFAEGLTVPIDYATSIGWGKELIMATADFTARLRDILMDQTEFCMLNAIVLTYPDAAGIQDKHQVTGLQTKMLDSLRKYMVSTYPEDHRRFGKMLLRLPALRTVSAKAAERFLSLTLDGSIQLSTLVSEMMS